MQLRGVEYMRMSSVLLCGSMLALVPNAALAGEEVLKGAPPPWVSVADLAGIDAKGSPAELLADFQHRIEGGVVYSYSDQAVRIDNSQTLVQQNTLDIRWLPDKGDLTVHRLEILREGKVIDLLAEGAKFDVIRREQGLEARLLDGELTATLSIPGLRVGDVLRTAYTVSVDDQALGEEAQVFQYLGASPWRVGMGRAIVSWPDGEEVFWKVEDAAGIREAELRDKYRYLNVALPLPEAKDMPSDAPSRYHRPVVLRVGSFDGWNELSRVMAPHYIAAAEVADGSEVAERAAAIMKQSSDPLERAALATRLVQDEVSYLMNGLEGGNYLPQAADFTWDKRYGDCKAKSVLLLALLRRMGIEAEPALVTTSGGDALPVLLPIPGDFDHVIVRALIGGQEYWLDGTSAATRLANIADVPPFHYALPLRSTGADLVPMTQRDKAVPDMLMTGMTDHSAGIDFPQMFTFEMKIAGAAGAQMEAMADAGDPQTLRRLAGAFAGREGLDSGVLTSVKVSYDKEAAVGTIEIEGVVPSSFSWENGKAVVDAGAGEEGFAFNPNRSRSEWRDIPVATPGPSFARIDLSMKLPYEGRGFSAERPGRQEFGFANTRVVTNMTLEGDTVRTQVDTWQGLGEVAPQDVAEAKRRVLRLRADTSKLNAPAEVTWRWELDDKQRRAKVAPFVAQYDRAIEFALEDDFGPLMHKAYFLHSMYEFSDALAVYDQLIDVQPSTWAHLQRSEVLLALGRRDDAITDMQAAYDLEPSNDTAFSLAREMAYAGRLAEASEMLEALPVSESELTDYADARAFVTGLAGDMDEALAVLEEALADKPQNADLLNADCWFRGLFNVALDNALASCTRAVERADDPAPALDSRAMVKYRLGDYAAAIGDLDEVLTLAPGIAASRYLRGVARIAKGDKGGQDDIRTALRMEPHLAEFYARHGVKPSS